MKIIEKMEEESKTLKTISLKEIANKSGIQDMRHQDALEILNKFVKLHKSYKIVKLDGKDDSLFECGGVKRNDFS